MPVVQPRVPQNLSEYARACMDAVARSGLGAHISIGGAFGLAHYHEYRGTNDIDAWWVEAPPREVKDRLLDAVKLALERFGTVRIRAWGDVASVEVSRDGRVAFSFQVAERTAILGEHVEGLWAGGVRLDSFRDIVASKMAALVNRGAPRDFRDIHELVAAGLLNVTECWELWETRQRAAREEADRRRAALAIRSHLARIESSRPLASIGNPVERAQAGRVRDWVTKELLRELSN